jgi:hypothetical protein
VRWTDYFSIFARGAGAVEGQLCETNKEEIFTVGKV